MLYPKPRPRKAHARPVPRLHGVATGWETLRRYVLKRDRVCVAWAFATSIDARGLHECRDRYGFPHSPANVGALSLEHVPDPGVKGLGMRREIAAPDDELHLVAMCHGANVAGPSEALRAFCRKWIADRETTTI